MSVIKPAGWSVATIGEVAKVSSGATPNRKCADFWGDRIPWITTSKINYGTIIEADEKLSEAGLTSCSTRLYPKGTILMALYGQGATRGRVGILGIEAAINQACAAIEPSESLAPSYLYYYLTYHYHDLRNLSQGGNQANLSGELVKSFRVLIPAPHEQVEISRTLDLWDQAADLTEQLIAAKKERRAWLMQQLLTGKHQLPGFSNKWRKVNIGDVTEESSLRNKMGLGVQAVRSVNKAAGMIPMHEHVIADDISRYKVIKPTWFAYNPMRLNIGSICQWTGAADALVSPDYVVFGCRKELMDHRYFNALRRSRRWKSYVEAAGSGSVRVRIYYDDLARMPFQLPTLREQERIADIIDLADREVDIHQRTLSALKYQKHGLMQQLLTGKRRVKVSASASLDVIPKGK